MEVLVYDYLGCSIEKYSMGKKSCENALYVQISALLEVCFEGYFPEKLCSYEDIGV